ALHMREKGIDPVGNESDFQTMSRKAALFDRAAVVIFHKAALRPAGKGKGRIEAHRAVFIRDFHKVVRLAEKGHVELVVRLKRGLDLRFIECGHKAVSLIGNDATREKILFEESTRFRTVRIVEGALGGKERRQRFEMDAKTAALVDLASSVIGRTAKCEIGRASCRER